MDGICGIDNCGGPVVARGYCNVHYRRFRKYGHPLEGSTRKGEAWRYFREVVLTYEGEECLDWPHGKTVYGRGQVWTDGRLQYVHRLACEAVNGPAPTPRHEAAHNCGKGHLGCVNPRHLQWKTPKENQADRLVHGTHCRGERCVTAKISEASARQIISLQGVIAQNEIATRFGLDVRQVRRIQTGQSWAWLR